MAEGVAENMEMTEQVAKAKPKKKKLPVVLVFLVLISAFGSSFQYGYNLWEVNHPSADLWNISAVSRQAKTSRSKGFIKFLDALQYSFFSFGGLVGSLFAGPLMDKCGRKGSLVSNSLFSLIAAALMGWSKVRRAYEFTILARFVTGICAGIFASVVPIYLGEIAPQNMRGVIIMVAQLFVAVGVVMAQLFGHPTILGNYRDWTMYMSIIGTSALFQLFLLPSFPESPRYLLIQKRNEKKAREALKVLRGRDDVEDELEELREEDLAEGAEKKMSVLRLIGFEQLRWQLLSVIILMCGRQLSGIYAAYYYAEKIFANMTGVTGQSARFVSVGSTITAIVMLLVIMSVVDTVGRRVLLLTGYGICSISCILLTMSLELLGDLLIGSSAAEHMEEKLLWDLKLSCILHGRFKWRAWAVTEIPICKIFPAKFTYIFHSDTSKQSTQLSLE
ncbi:solute carrier family 2, facilitated glucose transporter member 5-like isoform X3 [Hemicordylus capensis]|uniref:solute carrier family 2, facilitated glucose transporter member 5-like isoform X3 n=1 Tax=Hemicordylus capensis TaxID=884348 RepID=UPI0023038601|nr:solute carrier family 2, facilitated glucose transporter member 5-like isoform X3 [Hemicordylus capensis]